MSKISIERNQRALLDLAANPGNDTCADCKARNPRWASHNLGIFICVNCASVHRKIGTHITKVKSLTLDSWTKEQVEFMRNNGNIKSNAFYNPDEVRNRLPSNYIESERDSELEQYIRSKYEFKRFLDKSAIVASKLGPSRSAATRTQGTSNGPSSFSSTSQPTLLNPASRTQLQPPQRPLTAAIPSSAPAPPVVTQSRSVSQPLLHQPHPPPMQQKQQANGVWADLVALQTPSSSSSLPLQFQAPLANINGTGMSQIFTGAGQQQMSGGIGMNGYPGNLGTSGTGMSGMSGMDMHGMSGMTGAGMNGMPGMMGGYSATNPFNLQQQHLNPYTQHQQPQQQQQSSMQLQQSSPFSQQQPSFFGNQMQSQSPISAITQAPFFHPQPQQSSVSMQSTHGFMSGSPALSGPGQFVSHSPQIMSHMGTTPQPQMQMQMMSTTPQPQQLMMSTTPQPQMQMSAQGMGQGHFGQPQSQGQQQGQGLQVQPGQFMSQMMAGTPQGQGGFGGGSQWGRM